MSLQFRKALIKYGIKRLPISFHEFPMGSCGDASLLLGKYLDEMGLGQFDYVCGELGRQSHAWLEKDGIIVDITADQFDGVVEEIIVTDNNDFHKDLRKIPDIPILIALVMVTLLILNYCQPIIRLLAA
jgi:hypothetical protein